MKNMTTKYIPEKELARRWGISPRTLQDWRQGDSRNLPYEKISNRVRYLLEAVEKHEAEGFINLIRHKKSA